MTNLFKLVKCKMFHRRLFPRPYFFTNSFFWFKIDLTKPEMLEKNSPLVAYNQFSLYSLHDSEHIQVGGKNLYENFLFFIRKHVKDIKIQKMEIYTHLSFLGYVFNPVSFILCEDTDGNPHGIIEVGNTFNELKAYYVAPENFYAKDSFRIKTPKLFYVSPFVPMDSLMEFHFNRTGDSIKIEVDDFVRDLDNIKSQESRKMVETKLTGNEIPLTTSNLLLQTLLFPLQTLQVIFLIHWHAFRLFLLKIPYFKKTDTPQFQKEFLVWKKQ